MDEFKKEETPQERAIRLERELNELSKKLKALNPAPDDEMYKGFKLLKALTEAVKDLQLFNEEDERMAYEMEQEAQHPEFVPCQNEVYILNEERLKELQKFWSISKFQRDVATKEIWTIKQKVIAQQERMIGQHKEWMKEWYEKPYEWVVNKFFENISKEHGLVNQGYAVCMANRNDTPHEMLKYLAKHGSRVVRSAVAYNSNTPLGELRILAKDKCGEVAIIAEDNLLRIEKALPNREKGEQSSPPQ